MRTYYIYILASQRNGTLYIGVTSDLARRIWEHKNKSIPGFTSKYRVDKLVHVEEFDDIGFALQREKCLKKWPRAWKLALIERNNSNWLDLSEEIMH